MRQQFDNFVKDNIIHTISQRRDVFNQLDEPQLVDGPKMNGHEESDFERAESRDLDSQQ